MNHPSFSPFPPFPPQSLPHAVLAALCFFDLFECPLTAEEIAWFVPRELRDEGGEAATLAVVERFLPEGTGDAASLRSAVVETREGFWFLKGRQGTVNFRLVRSAIAQAYWKRVRRFLPLSRCVPFVQMAAVCNTLAFNSPTAQSDIDLFVVTKPGRIFTARTFLTLLFTLLGVRRHGNKVAGRFCLSFFVTEDALDLSGIAQKTESSGGEGVSGDTFGSDPYLWFWMRTLVPLYGADYYQKFAKANGFQAEVLVASDPGKALISTKFGGGWHFFGRFWEFVLGGWLGDVLENWLRKKQLRRHEKRRLTLGENSSVMVSDTMLKYHNIDRRAHLNQRFFDRYNSVSR